MRFIMSYFFFTLGVGALSASSPENVQIIEPLIVEVRSFSNNELICAVDNADVRWQLTYAGQYPVLSPNAKELLSRLDYNSIAALRSELQDPNKTIAVHVILSLALERKFDKKREFKRDFSMVSMEDKCGQPCDSVTIEIIEKFWAEWFDVIIKNLVTD